MVLARWQGALSSWKIAPSLGTVLVAYVRIPSSTHQDTPSGSLVRHSQRFSIVRLLCEKNIPRPLHLRDAWSSPWCTLGDSVLRISAWLWAMLCFRTNQKTIRPRKLSSSSTPDNSRDIFVQRKLFYASGKRSQKVFLLAALSWSLSVANIFGLFAHLLKFLSHREMPWFAFKIGNDLFYIYK